MWINVEHFNFCCSEPLSQAFVKYLILTSFSALNFAPITTTVQQFGSADMGVHSSPEMTYSDELSATPETPEVKAQDENKKMIKGIDVKQTGKLNIIFSIFQC
jgi:hypothetical protein